MRSHYAVRDEWEQKQEELQKTLCEVFGTEWTFEADLKQIYAYAEDGYAKQSLGSCVHEYVIHILPILIGKPYFPQVFCVLISVCEF